MTLRKPSLVIISIQPHAKILGFSFLLELALLFVGPSLRVEGDKNLELLKRRRKYLADLFLSRRETPVSLVMPLCDGVDDGDDDWEVVLYTLHSASVALSFCTGTCVGTL